MRAATVRSEAMLSEGFRLAPSFHVSPDQKALDVVAALKQSVPLISLCAQGGLFRGPIFRRVFAADPAFGRPYVTASDLEQAEVRPLASLSCVHGALLEDLALRQDTIALSCSGMNLGKAFYIRPDMDGLVASHDLIRVIVDPAKVRQGYLFAYLDSRFGRSAVRQSTHGGSVRHIEPPDLFELMIPRLRDDQEAAIHDLVYGASRLLADHTTRLDGASEALERAVGLDPSLLEHWEDKPIHLGWDERSLGEASLRPLNHDPRAEAIRDHLLAASPSQLGDLCDPSYFRGKQIFKREEASPGEGVMLLGQRAAFRLRLDGRYIARSSVDGNRLRVPAGTVLIPSHGTLGMRELYCRALIVTPRMADYAFSGDFFRCVPLHELIEPGYLYAFLRSRFAFRLLRSLSSGGKQQELTPQRMAELPIPRLDAKQERAIAREVDEAAAAFDEAVGRLTEARLLVERAVSAAN